LFGNRATLPRQPPRLGKEHVTPERISHLKRTLPADRRRAPVKDLELAPAWMHPILRNLAEE
jgi:hypothetical protein